MKPTSKPHYQNNQWQQCYASLKSDCRHCTIREQCLSPKSKNRRISRGEHEEVLAAHLEYMVKHPGIMRQRSASGEHPFGTLKRRAGWDHFLLRGLNKVRGEWSLMAWAYNFTRVMNLI
ncbi:MAG: transposase, partial [Gammaproteobacteria bacterium]|nr:transposase [Gammaproteobacteria bacterium]